MAATQAVRASGTAPLSGLRRFVDRYFYFLMSLLVAAVVVTGFSRTIGAGLLHPAVKPPALLWVHGAVFFAWVGLFVLQSALVRARSVRLHKTLGWYIAALGALIPILGIAITRLMSGFEINALHFDPNERAAFLPIPFLDMVVFTIVFGLAILWRKRPEYHRRLILVAACGLTAAAWGRLPYYVPHLAFYYGVDAFLLLGILRDLFLIRRIHPVYAWSIPAIVMLQLAAVGLMEHRPEWWLRLGRAFIGQPG